MVITTKAYVRCGGDQASVNYVSLVLSYDRFSILNSLMNVKYRC